MFYRIPTIVLPLRSRQHSSTPSYGTNSRNSLPFSSCYLCLGAVQNLLELCYTMTHAGVHVGLATFDVVVEVVAEQLNVRDGVV